MVSEENLEFLRGGKAQYLVGTPKAQLRRYEQALVEKQDWQEVEPGIEVKILPHPDGGQESFVLCRSAALQQKEKGMLDLQRQRLLTRLAQMDTMLRRRPAEALRIERRIGRWLGRHPAAERLLDVSVKHDAAGLAVGLEITERGAQHLGATGAGRVPVAHQLSRTRSAQTMEVVSPAPAGRGGVSHQ